MQLRRVDNPPNPYLSQHAEWLEPPPEARVEVFEEDATTILTENDSPDIPFRWSVNPYRGCQHACAYCYARPYHEYLGYGAGTDFDTKLVVKRNAPQLLAREFTSKKWNRESVTFSGITDCYQPLEAAYELTRQCLQVCIEFHNPVSVVTKGFLVVRDADLLAKLDSVAGARVFVSIPIADAEVAKAMEPQAPPPARRMEAIRRLSEAGVPVGIMISPVIPGLSDRDIPVLLAQAAAAGASSAGYTPLRLPGSVEPVFLSRLTERLPLHARRVVSRVREMRGGKLNDSRFKKRFRGSGEYWKTVEQMFRLHRTRLGLDVGRREGDAVNVQWEARRVSCEPAAARTGELLPPGNAACDASTARGAASGQLSFNFGADQR